MEEKIVTISNWWEDKQYEPTTNDDKPRLPKFNITIQKGEVARTELIEFLNNGEKIENQYGKSIMFKIKYKEVEMVWFVKAKSFSILKELKVAQPLIGKCAYVTRAGTTQSDTRWAIKLK